MMRTESNDIYHLTFPENQMIILHIKTLSLVYLYMVNSPEFKNT